MGTSRSTIGNVGGKVIATFTASGDSGPLLYHVHAPGNQPYDFSEIRACSEFTIGLGGSDTGLTVTMYFTTDVATANGTSANPVWFLCPSPSTEASAQWSNPMTNISGQNVLNFKAHAIALRAVAAGTANGTLNVLLLSSF